ncbi:MAG TPA: molybdenum cofactor guanylyltransferase [Pyrinomonadaceae bacterium]|jgi:molybdopterin-guanine dinucleotide biosynthesis protein A|nr:molybdenum cofactor guanylyltransferase [Pyrinomonadaceae bacterium]
MTPMFDVHGFILVGGASTRMGRAKAELKFGNQTGVELIAAALAEVADQVTTVGPPNRKINKFENIPDLRANWGPLAGIEAALRHTKSLYCLIVACDFPFVTGHLFKHLIESINDADAVVPLQSDGRPQSLCAIYRRSTCLLAAESAIGDKQHSPRALLERVHVRYLSFKQFALLQGSEHFFFNVNTPENYAQAQQIFARLLCEP